MARIKICKEEGCHDAVSTEGYCRLHYLKNWKRLRDEKKQKAAKKLNRYVDYVMKNQPDRYLDVIKKDLRSKDFERHVDEKFGSGEEGPDNLFDDPSFEEEVTKLMGRLKIEKDFSS